MTPTELIEALALPVQTRVDKRVPKTQLVENGAPTAADKRTINDGIEELIWVAALKPDNIGVPAYSDAGRNYLEIAVLSLKLRPKAKAARIRELIHRAIPYPLVLASADADGLTLSLAHLRQAENDASKTVLDGGIVTVGIAEDAVGLALRSRLTLAGLPKENLFVLYQGWLDCMIIPREMARLDAEIAALRANAEKTTQLNLRVEFNLQLKQLYDARARFAEQFGIGETQ
ncbi:MAG: DUF4391 domain-containing protein [Bacteroidales bacterium]|nr:DUF4391 domain-containing protein [Bacteroidales bacterium]